MLKKLVSRTFALDCRQLCCSSALMSAARDRSDQKWKKRNEHSWRWQKWGTAVPLLGFSVITTAKDIFGHKPFAPRNDLEDQVKKARVARMGKRFEEGLQLLQEALEIALQHEDQLSISRVYDEMANTYYEMGNLDEAEKLFRLLIQRLMTLHDKREGSHEFIEVSLKLADIFAQRGELDNAETGYMHCVTRQMKVLEEHLRKYLISHGAKVSDPHPVEFFGPVFCDPIALFGMCLEQYAFFLVKYRDATRLAESQECINEALKVSNQLFGSVSFHMVNLLNNYGAALIMKQQFEVAKKYLALGVGKVIQIDECSSLIPGYYCNYAEALFHCGQLDEALDYARRAVKLANTEEERIQNYSKKFLQELEADVKRAKRKRR